MTVSDESETRLSSGQKLKQSSWVFYVISFGIVLPVVALFVEFAWAWSAEILFDPIPTAFHVAMIAIVPVANFFGLLARYGHYRASIDRILFLNGVAIGISAFYTILFIPVMPLAAVALIWLIGLLPLAPVLSLIAAVMCRRAMSRPASTDMPRPLSVSDRARGLKLANYGIVAALFVIIAAELPLAVTEIGLRMAISQDSEEQLRGLRLLRKYADHDRLLSYCHARRGRPRDMISFIVNWDKKSINVDDARKVYFRVSGQAFNDGEPDSIHGTGFMRNGGRFDFDIDQGGNSVGKNLKDVRLVSSVIDGSVDADAAIAYLQWTFEFGNQSPRLAEARAQIRLPPGAVVSRLTLWIDGEEREAAFAGRGQARKAYQQVVRRQRDPVLVTTAGADTVLVQLYPIPVGGRMKARIGITVPLVIREETQAVLRLPHFKQRNFNIASDFEHSLWIESAARMDSQPAHLIFESANSGASTLRGKLDNTALRSSHSNILVSRNEGTSRSHAINNRAKDKNVVVQHIVKKYMNIDNLVIVIDGSISMQEHIGQLTRVFSRLPENIGVSFIVAGDKITELTGDDNKLETFLQQDLAEKLRNIDFEGGVDNIEALERAWSMAASQPNAAILWIHGSQPVILKSVNNLRQNWRRRPQGPILYDFPVSSRINRIAGALDDVTQFKVLPRIASLEEDLSYQISLWSGERHKLVAMRSAVTSAEPLLQASKTSDHLIRLWANDRILALIAEGDNDQLKLASEMATRYQLVTPVSGAVVLESRQQYAENGLQPVKEGTVPTIPEPETWLLIITTLLILSWAIYQRRNRFGKHRLIA